MLFSDYKIPLFIILYNGIFLLKTQKMKAKLEFFEEGRVIHSNLTHFVKLQFYEMSMVYYS